MQDSDEAIPRREVEIFGQQIPGNKGMSLQQGVMHNSLIQEVGRAENLPPRVQQVIKEIQAANSVEEKVAIAHNFTLGYMKYEMQFGGPSGEEDHLVPFPDIARNPHGDCDDYARFNAGLLLHGGVDPRHVFLASGLMKYDTPGANLQVGHAFVIVKNGDGYLLMDNNMLDTPEIDPAYPTMQGRLNTNGLQTPGISENNPVTAEIDYLCQLIDGRGYPMENRDALQKLTDHMNKFIQSFKNTAPGEPEKALDSAPAAAFSSPS
ncbi:MAG: hypothetical protein HY370_00650 [Proteobacteria bacterium]|nr:hypothetical protein [Pseudomonadota bacterium]